MQSDAEDEYQEILLKGRAPMQAIDPRVDPEAALDTGASRRQRAGVTLEIAWVESQDEFEALAGEWDSAAARGLPARSTCTAGTRLGGGPSATAPSSRSARRAATAS